MQNNTYNPDVLSCLANLSNDEVFTPPALANQMLDLLPNELWSNPDAKFLDPCCKSGVFLREIAKRLIIGLKSKFPDLQERLNHIYTNQLYGIAITEMTALLSRRSVYCSKTANGKYSVCDAFKDTSGNIVFQRTEHTWVNGRCQYCGASQSEYDRDESLETHAYQFIHAEQVFNMKFDVIIGNPPYQLTTGSSSSQAIPLYHKFIQQAKLLEPRYLSMIVPSRWFSGGMGLDSFREEMLKDDRLCVIHDFLDASECFPGVEIKGGVCYFLWDKDKHGECEIYTHKSTNIISYAKRQLLEPDTDIFIRYNDAIPVLRKIRKQTDEYLTNIIQPLGVFGLPTNFNDYKKKSFPDAIYVYGNKFTGFIHKNQISVGENLLNKYKVLLPKAIGTGGFDMNLNPIVTYKNSCCTFTYVVIGAFDEKSQAENLAGYLQTNFVKFLIGLKKITQDATRKVYSFVPMQDFNESWDDKKLYKKYGLTQKEIAFIESMVRPME